MEDRADGVANGDCLVNEKRGKAASPAMYDPIRHSGKSKMPAKSAEIPQKGAAWKVLKKNRRFGRQISGFAGPSCLRRTHDGLHGQR